MNFLNVCAPYVWKLPPYCQNALRSFEVLDIKITGNERLLYNAERLRSLSKLLEDKQRTATWAPMWIQVRNSNTKLPLNTPKLHRDLEIPNFDFYRKKEFSNARKTTWFMGDDKRGFIYLAGVIGWIFGAYAVKGHGLHYVSYFGAAKDVLAMATVEVDLGKVLPGTCMSVKWRGKPLFIKNRTPREIEVEAATDIRTLRDPQSPEQRVQKQEWLIVIGICTHLGCVPMANTGDFVGGFYCPCHGSHFDNLGRARKGPAPLNLVVPPYVFLSDSVVNIG